VITLGEQIDARNNPIHFPLQLLIEELQDILAVVYIICPLTIGLDWMLLLLRSLKIPFGLLYESYWTVWEKVSSTTTSSNQLPPLLSTTTTAVAMMPNIGQRRLETSIFVTASMTSLLSAWIQETDEEDQQYCRQTIRSGRMTTMIRHLNKKLTQLPDALKERFHSVIDQVQTELHRLTVVIQQEDMIRSTETFLR
jgi:hypothetical protein